MRFSAWLAGLGTGSGLGLRAGVAAVDAQLAVYRPDLLPKKPAQKRKPRKKAIAPADEPQVGSRALRLGLAGSKPWAGLR